MERRDQRGRRHGDWMERGLLYDIGGRPSWISAMVTAAHGVAGCVGRDLNEKDDERIVRRSAWVFESTKSIPRDSIWYSSFRDI